MALTDTGESLIGTTLTASGHAVVGSLVVEGSHVFGLAAAAYTLTAASGTFTVAGQTAGLRYGYTMAVSSGHFILNANPTFPVALARTILFELTGQAAAAVHGSRLPAAAGSYALTGQAASLTQASPARLIAAAGVHVLTGHAASFIRIPGGEVVTLLGDGSGYPAVGHLTIGTEDIAYTGYTVAGGVTTFTGITRGARGTTVQTHVAGALAHNGEQLRRGQRLTLFAGYAPLDEEDYGPGPGYVRMQIQAVNSQDNGMTWLVGATDIQRFIQRSVFTNASSDNPAVIGPDHPITLALKVLLSTGTGSNGPYDVLPADQGAAVPQAFVATDLLEFIRDAVVPGVTMQFREIQLTDAKSFVEGQCFRPLNLVPFITQRGRYSARSLRQPIFVRSGTVLYDAFRAA